MSAFPSADRAVLGAILHRQARERPDALFLDFPDSGGRWTFADTLLAAQRAGAGLQSLGVQRGERVLCWLPNGEGFLRTWFGANYIGAVNAPCNLSWRGRMLENALVLSGARVAVVHAELLPRLAEVDLHALREVIVVGAEPTDSIPGLTLHPATLLEQPRSATEPVPPLQPWDEMQLLFTSGTTGPSKGACSSYAHMAAFIIGSLPEHYGENETFLCLSPLFHAGGACSIHAQLIMGGAVVLPSRFRSDAFWPMVRDSGVTTTTLIGIMTKFLLEAPPSSADRDHPLKVTGISPLNHDALAFGERFGVRLWTSYGATEVGSILSCRGDASVVGTAGRPRPDIQVRLVDDNDLPVERGAMGELVARADQPWTFFSAYVNDPAASHRANRNGWYHTGDLMREGDDGLFYFKDRKKDSIRRRGENISSQEVEVEVLLFAGITEAAAYAVPADDGEDEVMICIGTADAPAPDWPELVKFLQARMSHFMVPRYYRVVTALPRNETGKVRKDVLREEGVTTCSWDREAAGITLKGERLGSGSA